MGSYATYLKLTNNTGKKVSTSVSEVNSYDWDGVSRPDNNYNGITINSKDSVVNREELNSNSNGAWYRLTLTFDNGDNTRDVVSFRNDQYDARNGIQNPRYYNLDGPQAQNYLLIQQVDKDNATNEFTIVETKFNPKSWMSKISDSKSIAEITIPGTHDTAARQSSLLSLPAQTQSTTTAEQLNYGIRFLDVRAKAEPVFYQSKVVGAKLIPYHGIIREGDDIKDILDACQSFLRDNPTETIIMSLKNEESGDDIFFSNTFQDYLSNYSSIFYTSEDIPPMKDVRGKIVLVRRFAYSSPPALGLNLSNGWTDNGKEIPISYNAVTSGSKQDVIIQDFYNTVDSDEKWSAVQSLLDKAKQVPYETLYINFSSAVGGSNTVPVVGSIPYPKGISIKINTSLKSYFKSASIGRYGSILMDFPGMDLIRYIIATNIQS